MWPGVVFFDFILFGYAEPLKSVNLCFSSSLVWFEVLFPQMLFCVSISFSPPCWTSMTCVSSLFAFLNCHSPNPGSLRLCWSLFPLSISTGKSFLVCGRGDRQSFPPSAPFCCVHSVNLSFQTFYFSVSFDYFYFLKKFHLIFQVFCNEVILSIPFNFKKFLTCLTLYPFYIPGIVHYFLFYQSCQRTNASLY